MAGKSNFKVVIVGGGIAGLALANELQCAGIDFVLLERRSVIDPQVGASIGMLPNGSRILDQVGCYEDVLDLVEPTVLGFSHKADGSLIGEPTDAPVLLATRSAYNTCFLDRQWVLRILADHVQDKSKILLNKDVDRIEQSKDKATVFCKDGTSYDGDVVVGADGVYSKVRHEMWRQAEEAGEGKRVEKDKKAMFAEYNCLFGISNAVEGMIEGQNRFTYDKDRSTLVIVGKNGRIFWFVFSKMDRVYKVGEIPRYTQEDKENFIKQHGDLIIRNNPRVTVKDFYKAQISSTLVALEEAAYENWTYGRMVCAGDSIHKMTPNLGAGGNSAIESTAIVANQLKHLVDQYKSARPPLSAVEDALKRFQTLRHTRITETMKMANGLTRIQAMKTGVERFIAYYVIPNAGDYMAEMYADFQIGAPLLEYLPPPPRSLEATMPFNEEQGWGFIESKAKRAFTALPFKFYPISFLDSLWRTPEAFFLSSTLGLDKVSHDQGFSFLIDVSTIYGIWLVESARRSNLLTLAQLPLLFGFSMQHLGGGFMAPIYWFLFYIYSPVSNFKASDNRLTNITYTYSVLPLMLLFSIVPTYLMYQSDDLKTRQYWGFGWQMFPVWVSLGQYVLAKTGIMPAFNRSDRIYKPRMDVAAVRLTVGTFGIISAAAWIYTLLTSTYSMADLFIPSLHPEDNFFSLTRYFLQTDQVFMCGSCLLWLLYAYGDFKAAGMISQSWLTILALGSLSLVSLGPGATFAVGWLFREETLLTKRHKSAVTKGSNGGKKVNGVANGKVGNGKAH
ncbi:FAD binding domain protein [Rhizodiscina lignyota]|uniref:FAD binding domain protein n=1 Tax=Rhizodiscina lignyota TaxID=1504668 RepID=A0A9P4MDE6_9PEZI|nr:FAD binding domain protein [Rhizodiscina lignyota]